jgi:NAD-dependent SIR2 family protein deacetylase
MKAGITFEEMVHTNMFIESPQTFWYLFGNLYNKYKEAEPHEGYSDLLKILTSLKGQDGWFLYHEGTDLLYEKAGFPQTKNFMQGKGNVFFWQCKPCRLLRRHAVHTFRFDHTKHQCVNIPACPTCKKPVRPNINLKADLDWMETVAYK